MVATAQSSVHYLDAKFFSRITSDRYNNKEEMVMHHIRYIDKKAVARIGDSSIIIENIQKINKRVDSRVALKMVIALPNDIEPKDYQTWLELVRDFICEKLDIDKSNFYAVIHEESEIAKQTNIKNLHAHIVLTPIAKTTNKPLNLNSKTLSDLHQSWDELLERRNYTIKREEKEKQIGKLGVALHYDKELKEKYIDYVKNKYEAKAIDEELQRLEEKLIKEQRKQELLESFKETMNRDTKEEKLIYRYMSEEELQIALRKPEEPKIEPPKPPATPPQELTPNKVENSKDFKENDELLDKILENITSKKPPAPPEPPKPQTQQPNNLEAKKQEEQRRLEEAKRQEEEKRKKEQERLEKERQEQERLKLEEQRRREEEQKRLEEAKRIEEERKKQQLEALRKLEEQKRLEELKRKELERQRQEQERRLEEEKKKEQERKRLEELKRKQEQERLEREQREKEEREKKELIKTFYELTKQAYKEIHEIDLMNSKLERLKKDVKLSIKLFSYHMYELSKSFYELERKIEERKKPTMISEPTAKEEKNIIKEETTQTTEPEATKPTQIETLLAQEPQPPKDERVKQAIELGIEWNKLNEEQKKVVLESLEKIDAGLLTKEELIALAKPEVPAKLMEEIRKDFVNYRISQLKKTSQKQRNKDNDFGFKPK